MCSILLIVQSAPSDAFEQSQSSEPRLECLNCLFMASFASTWERCILGYVGGQIQGHYQVLMRAYD